MLLLPGPVPRSVLGVQAQRLPKRPRKMEKVRISTLASAGVSRAMQYGQRIAILTGLILANLAMFNLSPFTAGVASSTARIIAIRRIIFLRRRVYLRTQAGRDTSTDPIRATSTVWQLSNAPAIQNVPTFRLILRLAVIILHSIRCAGINWGKQNGWAVGSSIYSVLFFRVVFLFSTLSLAAFSVGHVCWTNTWFFVSACFFSRRVR